MRFGVLFFVFVLMSCSPSKKVGEQKMEEKVSIDLISFTKTGEYLNLDLAIINNTEKPISIAKHKSLDEKEVLDAAPPFYQMEFLPYDLMCEYEIEFMDQRAEDLMKFNYDSDFITINPKDKYLFKVKSKDYLLGICDESSKQVKVLVKYAPNKVIFNQEYFMRRNINKKGTSEYFAKLKQSFQTPIVSDTLVIKY